MLALHIGSTHKDFTLHIHQGTDGGSCNPMLSGTGFGDDMRFTHLLCHQNLTDGIVNLVRTGMIQILTLQIELASILFAHSLRKVKRGRTANIILQERIILFFELLALNDRLISLLKLSYTLI